MAQFTLKPFAVVSATELVGNNATILGQVDTLDGTGTEPTRNRTVPNELVVNFGRIDTTGNSTGTILESGIVDTTVNATLRIYIATVNRNGALQDLGNTCNCIVDQDVDGIANTTNGRTNITTFSANFNTYTLQQISYSISPTNLNLLNYEILLTHNQSSYGGGAGGRRWLTIDDIELDIEVIELVPPGKSQAIWV